MPSDDLKTKSVLVYDHGLFTGFAQRLARDFARVVYFSPWQTAFPHKMDTAIGDGLEGIERTDNFFDAVEESDLIVFPDCADGDLQEFLRVRGARVWGSGGAQWLEQDRTEAAKEMMEVGISVPQTETIKGMTALREFVDETEDKWIKISLYRGDYETFHHIKPFITHTFLDVVQRRFGPQAESVEFVVVDSVPGTEIGWDCHCIDGKYPKLGLYGLEMKDRGLVGVMKELSTFPQSVQDVYTKLSPFFADGQYRNYMSVEMRMEAGKDPVAIDPCLRLGSPCAEGWMEMVDNLAEIVWEGAAGNLVEVKPKAKFCALAVIDCPWAKQNWTPIIIPDEIKQWVKMKNHTVIDGENYYVPTTADMAEIGVVVGIGDTLDEAIALVEERAEMIEGYELSIATESLREGLEVIEEGEALGITFD